VKFALLGDVQFELLASFDEMNGKFGSDYAEHARIEGKPRLQWIGDKLDDWSIRIKLHLTYCDPDVEIATLRSAMNTHVPLPFVLANGDHKGEFVIVDLSVTPVQMDGQGAMICAEVSLTLKEFIDHPLHRVVKPDMPGIARPGLPTQAIAKTGVADIAKPALTAAKLMDAVAAGRDVYTTVAAAGKIVSLARDMQSNPLAAIEQLRYGVPGFDRIVKAADKFGVNLAPLQASLTDTVPLLVMSGSVGAEAKSTLNLLSGLTQNNLSGSLISADTSLARIDKELTQASPALQRLSAKVAVRDKI
jgi:phage protein U